LGEGGDGLTAYRSSSNNGCGNVWGFAGGTSSGVLKIVTEHIKTNNGTKTEKFHDINQMSLLKAVMG